MVTWRVAAALLLLGGAAVAGAGAIGLDPWSALGIAAGAVLLLTALDWLVAAPAAEVKLRREGATQVRLGDSVTVTLHVTNDSVRTMRAEVRDAWVPSAGAADPYAHDLTIDPGETAALPTELTPTRRGDRPAARVTIRSYGPLGLAFRQTRRRRAEALTPPWTNIGGPS